MRPTVEYKAITEVEHCTVLSSCRNPKGGASYDPSVLLEPKTHFPDGRIDPLAEQIRTFDTFEGPERPPGEDWYELRFARPRSLNRLVMVTGFPYVDGGWWTSFRIEYRSGVYASWRTVGGVRCFPSYDFTDSKEQRRPFECYVLTFDRITTSSIRIVGTAGGTAHFTSLSFLAPYDVSPGHHPLELHRVVPIPRLFQLLSTETIWRISRDFVHATGLALHVPFLEFYSDIMHPAEHWTRAPKHTRPSEADLWVYVGLRKGWLALQHRAHLTTVRENVRSEGPYVEYYFEGRFARACAPILVDGDPLATFYTENPVPVAGMVDADWVGSYFGLETDPRSFEKLMANSFPLPKRSLSGIAGLLGYVARELGDLAAKRLYSGGATSARAQPVPDSARRIVRRAIDLIERNVTSRLSVADLASMLDLNPSYLAQVFAAVTGRHPNRTIARRKIDYAKLCFERYEFSVTDTANLLGYSPSHFYRLFKTYAGTSPQEYVTRLKTDRVEGPGAGPFGRQRHEDSSHETTRE